MNVAEETSLAVGTEGEELSQIWDPKRLGRIIDGARIRAGYDRMADLVVDMARRTGVSRHENTLYDIKNGKRLPDLELMTALMITLHIPHREVAEAITPEFREQYKALFNDR